MAGSHFLINWMHLTTLACSEYILCDFTLSSQIARTITPEYGGIKLAVGTRLVDSCIVTALRINDCYSSGLTVWAKK